MPAATKKKRTTRNTSKHKDNATMKQLRAARYLVDPALSETEALRRAGYVESVARTSQKRIRNLPVVKAEMERLTRSVNFSDQDLENELCLMIRDPEEGSTAKLRAMEMLGRLRGIFKTDAGGAGTQSNVMAIINVLRNKDDAELAEAAQQVGKKLNNDFAKYLPNSGNNGSESKPPGRVG